MLVKICLLAVLLELIAADCDALTQAAIVQCYTPYLQYYGLAPSNGILPGYLGVAGAIETKLDQLGQKAAQDLCDHTTVLGSCLNATMPNSFDVDCYNHIVIGNNRSESSLYIEEQAIHDYECGAGLQVYLAEFYCVRAARNNNQPAIQQCDTNLNDDLANGIEFCKAYDKYISCNSAIYSKACDYNAGVLMCNIFQHGMDSVVGYCDQGDKLTACGNYRLNPKIFVGIGKP
ncbi:unnamed protein product, partial [Mesorhabditis spiculigera]